MTVTMNISNTLVDTFLPRLTIGSGIRICNFTIKNKSQCESGDADCCIALTTKSTFETIPFVCTEHKLAPDFTISQLSEAHCHYSVGSFGAIGTSYHLTKTHLEVHIKDGDLQEDMATVLISTTYTELCATLQQLFSIVDMPFILFKNIVRNGPQGTRSFRPSQSTFIEELNDQCTKAHLETLAKCNIQFVEERGFEVSALGINHGSLYVPEERKYMQVDDGKKGLMFCVLLFTGTSCVQTKV
ncbi:uncharacterized protein LOC131049705 isoform X3 [Cryptomeria japonica]|uniref:uncharacterized protein LOC131049705 isoform X3 n=1 Tax=Cryptomeria japonica TaxID=3369 RepID=UPI0027DA0EF0|nr:uncharacterized protein LOC131049705 isoform X3 [Cryptomeria japonica]